MDAHRHCPHCGISMRPTATACPACFVAEVKRILDARPAVEAEAAP